MRVSEKSLELNVGAELLDIIRNKWGYPKTYLQGLTQKQESEKGVDFYAHLCPCAHILAFQFKRPSSTEDYRTPYKFVIQKVQHSKLYELARRNRGSVYYVLPFYASNYKLQRDVPRLLKDTWLLPVDDMQPDNIFKGKKSTTVYCYPSFAKINPEFPLIPALELEMGHNVGIPAEEFAAWYSEVLSQIQEDSEFKSRRRRKTPGIFRGLHISIYFRCNSR